MLFSLKVFYSSPTPKAYKNTRVFFVQEPMPVHLSGVLEAEEKESFQREMRHKKGHCVCHLHAHCPSAPVQLYALKSRCVTRSKARQKSLEKRHRKAVRQGCAKLCGGCATSDETRTHVRNRDVPEAVHLHAIRSTDIRVCQIATSNPIAAEMFITLKTDVVPTEPEPKVARSSRHPKITALDASNAKQPNEKNASSIIVPLHAEMKTAGFPRPSDDALSPHPCLSCDRKA